jgi:hypothetical protein
VAGVAHEINTPLGICVTATSHLVELKLTREDLAGGQLDEDGLQQFFDIIDQSLRIMTTNTQRAAALVRSFKQVAVDQSSDDIRSFNLRRYLDEVLLAAAQARRASPSRWKIECAPSVQLASCPGAYRRSSPIWWSIRSCTVFRGEPVDRIRGGRRARCWNSITATTAWAWTAPPWASCSTPSSPPSAVGGSASGAHPVQPRDGALGGTVKVVSAPGMAALLRFPKIQRKVAA